MLKFLLAAIEEDCTVTIRKSEYGAMEIILRLWVKSVGDMRYNPNAQLQKIIRVSKIMLTSVELEVQENFFMEELRNFLLYRNEQLKPNISIMYTEHPINPAEGEVAEKEIQHTVTGEDIANNPELPDVGVKEGDVIGIPEENETEDEED